MPVGTSQLLKLDRGVRATSPRAAAKRSAVVSVRSASVNLRVYTGQYAALTTFVDLFLLRLPRLSCEVGDLMAPLRQHGAALIVFFLCRKISATATATATASGTIST